MLRRVPRSTGTKPQSTGRASAHLEVDVFEQRSASDRARDLSEPEQHESGSGGQRGRTQHEQGGCQGEHERRLRCAVPSAERGRNQSERARKSQ